MTSKIAGLVYARLDSSRLPGKALKEMGGTKLIDIVFARARRMNVAETILLTTDRAVDTPLAEYCEKQGYEVFRGDAFDLVKRTLQAIEAYQLDGFVRINGDSPLLEPTLVNKGLAQLNQEIGFVSNLFQRTFPYGVAVECVSSELFRKFSEVTREPEREHVTSHLYRLSESFKKKSLVNASDNHSHLRLTVDTPEDHERLSELAENGDITTEPYWKLCKVTPPVTETVD